MRNARAQVSITARASGERGEPRMRSHVLVLGAALAYAAHDELIYDAVARGRVSKVRALVGEDPARAEQRDFYGATPLHWACQLGQPDAGAALLEPGRIVNLADDDGVTPLMECARHCSSAGHVTLLRLLLSAGADPSRRSSPTGKQLPWRLEMSALEMAAAVPAPGVHEQECVRELEAAVPHRWSSAKRQLEVAVAPPLPHLDVTGLDAAVKAARASALPEGIVKSAEARLALARRQQAPLARWLSIHGPELLEGLVSPWEQSLLWGEVEAEVKDSAGLAAMPHERCVALLLKHVAMPTYVQGMPAGTGPAGGRLEEVQAKAARVASRVQSAAAADSEARHVRATLEPRLQQLLLQLGRLWTKSKAGLGLSRLVGELGAALLAEEVRTLDQLAALEPPTLRRIVAQLSLSKVSQSTRDGSPRNRGLSNDDAAAALAGQLQAHARQRQRTGQPASEPLPHSRPTYTSSGGPTPAPRDEL